MATSRPNLSPAMSMRPAMRQRCTLALKLSTLAALLLPLGGCMTMIGGSGLELYCGTKAAPGLYQVVRLSHADTQGTIDQVRANNAVHDAVCP